MKRVKYIGVGVLTWLGILLAARGEELRTDINPALLYYQAFLVASSLTDMEYLVTNTWNWQGQKLPEQFGKVVANYAAELKLVRQAAQQKVPCDWGIDLSRGVDTLLPHLASAKRAAQAIEYQAMWDLQQGNEAEARDDLIAGLALGRNVSKNGPLISVLVAFAIENIVNTTVAENFHRFSPATLQQLADGFAAAPARGTVGDSEPGEKIIHDWVLSRIEELRRQYPDDNARAMGELRQMLRSPNLDTEDKDWEQLTNAAGGTPGGIVRLIRDEEASVAKLFKIMALPYGEYEAQMKVFTAEVQKAGNPLFLQELNPLQATRRREFISLENSAMVRAAIEYKLHGEDGLKSVLDPCGQGPFTLQRFVFKGVDRGFKLTSAFDRGHVMNAYIFIEKDGPPFYMTGDLVGQPMSP